jgi:hypothetical protein
MTPGCDPALHELRLPLREADQALHCRRLLSFWPARLL